MNLTSNNSRLFTNKNQLLLGCLLFATLCLFACKDKPEQKPGREPVDYIKQIPGISEPIPAGVAEKGEVLVAYSDCATCHKQDQKLVGPAFKDIAKRYPANKIYIEILAQKVIAGGKGSWGSPVMDPHPKLSLEDAKIMVSYILSMKE
jgi:cytochrome c